jgi:Eco57I restriction-modification methylase/TaqI-like C-terminal specificity domain
MNKNEAIALVQAAFDADYGAQSFERFVSNLFKGEYTPLDKRRDGHYVREAFRSFVQGYRILGTYQDAEGSSLDILEVTLQRESSLDRARTAQRNFVADYLKKNGKDAALIAFLSPDQHDWRFSLVKLEYSLEVKDGKVKTEEELTPAKRWSFLIGRHEGSHTVQSRFVSLLQDSQKPLLKELEEAFNIESVTDEFFKKYCELFFRMKDSLDKLLASDPAIKADFEAKELTTVDFAKKTLGQMAFLYFLQKKGWFGVAPGKPWGTGPKDFLRQLFNRREKYGKNFFDDVLEPLFYEALAQDRGVEAIYPRLNNCRMPFLNGGLFEPMNGYAWETTNIRLPDELFSNSNRTPEGDKGDGILDIFDRYNFTVNENEPLEKEVAVDPEMLGKVFENLLEVLDRKSKGTFYTPREIVHYMCQQSLINFLDTEVGFHVPRSDIETLIKSGSQIIQNDALVLEKGREGTYRFMLPESIRTRASELDQALAKIKVCDPAVGSGAFPLGMLNEIVQARQALGVHLRRSISPYDLKMHSISHSIYGVDIDPGAVEISKLRLWLALVVEENEPHPLPNLEHKIMQGNSLLTEYEGIKLFDDAFLDTADTSQKEREEIDAKLSALQREYFALHSSGELTEAKKFELERDIKKLSSRKKSLGAQNELLGQEISIFDKPRAHQAAYEKMEKLRSKVELFITESRRSNKQRLKDEIDTLKWELIEASLHEQAETQKLEQIKKLRRANVRPFFVWKLEFADVFQERGGFDVTIANPPYVFARDSEKKGITEKHKEFFYKNFRLAEYQVNLYPLFIELAHNMMKPSGTLCFITPNNWMTINTNKTVREFILEQSNVTIVNFLAKVFESASVDSSIIIFDKSNKNDDVSLFEYEAALRPIIKTTASEFMKEHNYVINIDRLKSEDTSPLVKAIESKAQKLADYAQVKAGLMAYEVGKGTPPQTKQMKDERVYHSTERMDESYITYLDGKDVSRFHRGWSGDYLKYGPNLAAPRKIDLFNTPRILVRQIPAKPPYCIHACFEEKYILNDRNSMNVIQISCDPLFLLGVLNSKAISYWFIHKFGKLQRGIFPQFKINELKIFPVPRIEEDLESKISATSKKLIELMKNEEKTKTILAQLEELNQTLDALVYQAFELDEQQVLEIERDLSRGA